MYKKLSIYFYRRMSFFEKCETYLNRNGIELTDNDYTPDGRLQVDNYDNIVKWDFSIQRPNKKELDIKESNEDKKNRNQKKQLKEKIRNFKKNKIAVLSQEEVLNILDELETGHSFICKNRLYIIVASPNSNNDIFASFPNDINKDFDIKPNSSNFAMG